MSLLEKRYAEAMLGISVEKNLLDSHNRELGDLTELFMDNTDFKDFLLNPQIRTEVKKSTLTKVLEGNISLDILNMLKLLVDKNKVYLLPGIFKEFRKLAAKYCKTLEITVYSPLPVTDEQLLQIKNKYCIKHKGSFAETRIVIDPSLIGGIKIKVGDEITDGSVKGKLEDLRKLLMC